MFRFFATFVGLVVMLACGVGVAAWPRERTAAQMAFSAQQMKASYVRVRAGITPVSGLAALGFDTARARKLSYLGAMEQFMPGDSFGFDTLDPAVQGCFEAQDRCTAFIFSMPDYPAARVVLLVEGGRIAYKSIASFGTLAAARRQRLARN